MMTDELVLRCPASWYDRPIRVLLIGVGGTGGEMLDALFRVHTCLKGLDHPYGLQVTAYDGDTVEDNNIGRQRFWSQDVGANKAVTAIQRLNMYGGLSWEGVPFPLSLSLDSISHFDIIITAVDSAMFRYQLWDLCKSECLDTLWLDGGVDKGEGQVICGHLGLHDKKIPSIGDLYRDELNKTLLKPAGCATLRTSLAAQGLFVNRLCADIMGDLFFELIHKGQLRYHGNYFSISPVQCKPLLIDKTLWKTFGYAA